MVPSLKISVDFVDAFQCDADVSVLKYAQGPYGVDEVAFGRLARITSNGGSHGDTAKPSYKIWGAGQWSGAEIRASMLP